MSKIRIKNFGPIKEGLTQNDGWIDIKKVTMFIGNQGSGKSTVAKLISTIMWIEKALTKGVYDIKHFTNHNRFRKKYCAYHRIDDYFFDLKMRDFTEIEYLGESYSFHYYYGKLEIEPVSNTNYRLPKIAYVPAERNFISSVAIYKMMNRIPESLVEFMSEYDNAKKATKGGVKLPFADATVEYDNLNDIVSIKGNDYKTRLSNASSGFHSAIPLFLVSQNLATNIRNNKVENRETISPKELERFKQLAQAVLDDNSLSSEQQRVILSMLGNRFNNSAFINIVEEPELNLFPTSQMKLLYSLLEFANMSDGNKLIMTTHSPYLLIYLSLAIQGKYLYNKLLEENRAGRLGSELNSIVPLESLIAGDEVVVYQLSEDTGTIEILKNYEGIPSDQNYLNNSLAAGNELFDSLLEIEQSL